MLKVDRLLLIKTIEIVCRLKTVCFSRLEHNMTDSQHNQPKVAVAVLMSAVFGFLGEETETFSILRVKISSSKIFRQ